MAWRLGMRALGLVSTLVLVRLLAPSDFGLIALATGFMQTIDGMMMLGTEEAIIREASPGRDYYDTAFTLNLLRGLLVALLVLVAAFPAAGFFGEPRLGPILLFVATLPLLDGLANIGAVDFRRDFAFHKEFAMMVLPKLGGILAAITAAVLLRSYVAMLVGMGVNRGLRTVMSYVMHPHRPRLTLGAWRGLIGYSVWTWLLSLAVLLRDRCDTLLLGRLLGAAPVGFYAVGAEVAALPTTELVEPLCRASFSGFAAARRAGAEVDATFVRLIGLAVVVTLPAGVGLALIASPLVRIAFGVGWDDAVPVLQVLAAAGTMTVFGQVSLHLLSAHALLGRLVGITLLGAGLRVGLLVGLIPPYGLVGAAWAVGAASVVEQALTVGMAVRWFRVDGSALLAQVWRPMVATATMAAVLWLVGSSPTTTPWARVLAGTVYGAGVYITTLLGLWLASGRPVAVEADVWALLRRRGR